MSQPASFPPEGTKSPDASTASADASATGSTEVAAPAGGKQAVKKPAKKKPIDLYFWPTPNGWKVSIMLEECRLPYNVIPVNIARGEQFTDAFLKISPNNKIPAIVDPDGPGGDLRPAYERVQAAVQALVDR